MPPRSSLRSAAGLAPGGSGSPTPAAYAAVAGGSASPAGVAAAIPPGPAAPDAVPDVGPSASVAAALAKLTADLLVMQTEISTVKTASAAKIDELEASLQDQASRNAELVDEIASLKEAAKDGKGKEKDTRVFLPTAPDSPYFPFPRNHSSMKPFIAPLKGEDTAHLLKDEALEEYKTTHWVAKSLHDCIFHLDANYDAWFEAVADGKLPPNPERSSAFLEALSLRWRSPTPCCFTASRLFARVLI